MSIKIIFLGDVMLGENLNHFGRGIRTKFFNSYPELIKQDIAEKLFQDIDFLFYNFEFSLVDDDFKFDDIYDSVYCSTVDSLNTFPKKIKKIVNIANNHFSQHGRRRSKFTKKILREKGYYIIGESNEPIQINWNGMKLLFWGVSLISEKNYCNEYFFSTYEDITKNITLPSSKKKR